MFGVEEITFKCKMSSKLILRKDWKAFQNVRAFRLGNPIACRIVYYREHLRVMNAGIPLACFGGDFYRTVLPVHRNNYKHETQY